MQTLSNKNNVKIGASIHPHLSCSLVELIYHCVYCTPRSSLFMLWQNKRQRSREVLRTVFVCHRVPFLIPQAPAMPGGAACGGGSRRKARLRCFFLLLSKWHGGWVRRRPVWFLKSRTPSRGRSSCGLFLCERKLLTIICNLNLCKREDWRRWTNKTGHDCFYVTSSSRVSLKAWLDRSALGWKELLNSPPPNTHTPITEYINNQCRWHILIPVVLFVTSSHGIVTPFNRPNGQLQYGFH